MASGLYEYENPSFESPKYTQITTVQPHRKVSQLSHKNDTEYGSSASFTTAGQDSSKKSATKSEADIYVEDDKNWFYQFCLKCQSTVDEKPTWQPEYWNKICPSPYCMSYRQFSRLVALIFIGVFSYCILYSIVGDIAMPPKGNLFQLIFLSISAHIGGWLMSLTRLPALVGMLLTGVLFQNLKIVDIDQSFTEINNNLSNVALVIIMTKAGLELDPVALRRLKITVPKLSILPWLTEAGVAAILSKYLLHFTWPYAVLLGTIIAAVAPAVVVPCLFRLRAKGYGVAKGIPTLIIAVASIGDATTVAIFGIIKSFMFSDLSLINGIIMGPISIFGGIGVGILWGILCNITPERNDPFMAPLRVLLLLAGGMGAVFGGDLIGYSGAGPLACVTAAFVSIYLWSKTGWNIDDNPATTAFDIFWMIFQPILFGITGARIKIHELEGDSLLISLGIVIAAVVIRILATILLCIGSNLNTKEKVFVSISWMCKAIVQAALAPTALSLVKEGTPEYAYSKDILITSILSIIVTAPTGSLLTIFLGPHLLTKAKMPSLREIRRRKRSHRLSFRDISITNVEEQSTGEARKVNSIPE